MNKTKLNTKNYIIVVSLIILTICACYAFYNLYNIHQENKINTSPLATKEILYEDLKNTTRELDADTLLVISYTQNKKIYNNEVDIKKFLNKKNLLDNIMYLDVTEYLNDDTFLDDLNKVLKLDKNEQIKTFPALVYYKDGVITKVIDSSEHLLNKNDFEYVVDVYELAS